MSQNQSFTQVLIVGAGPTGLAAAAFLNKLGVSVRVIDKNSARSIQSKALGVHAGSLECFDHLLGPTISQQMVQKGFPVKEAWMTIEAHPAVRLDLSKIPSRYNFILILPQSETEKILEEYLKTVSVEVEREKEFLKIEDSGSILTAQVRLSSGEIEEIRANFMIGSDGAHSSVRQFLQIPFLGKEYIADFILADLKGDFPWPFGSIRTFLSKKGVVAFFPIKENNLYRIVLVSKKPNSSLENSEIDGDQFCKILGDFGFSLNFPLEFFWLSRFRVHHRMVSAFQKGKVFLAGDAAHIHSPVGGQGMNTGIQDVFNLSDKIYKVLCKNAPLKMLEDYQKERLPIARQVLRGTDFASRVGILSESKLVQAFKEKILPKLLRIHWVQKKMIEELSEIKIARREILRMKK